jgi:uncharacterized protein
MTTRVAIIGSGMAGLAAAHGCREIGFDVTLFESSSGHGMAAHAMHVDGGIVDVPLRIMGEGNWDRTLDLARSIGMETFNADVRTSCSWLDRRTWFRSGRMPLLGWPMIGSWRYLGIRSARLMKGLARLSRMTRRLPEDRGQMTLGEFVDQVDLHPQFWRGLILPILSTICTCDEQHLRSWPAAQLLGLLDDILHSSELVRLKGGTFQLAEALGGELPAHDGSAVRSVREIESGIEVLNERGKGGTFDRVIVATQANQLDFLDDARFGAEREVLAGIPYAEGELIVHRDERFMPRRYRDWTALNFMMDRQLNAAMFTVWVNAVEPTIGAGRPVFQTWNPLFEPLEKAVIARIPMQRAVVDRRNENILRQLRDWHDQPDRRLFYCGSWAYPGVPLLETAVRSAQAVVERFSEARGTTAREGVAALGCRS